MQQKEGRNGNAIILRRKLWEAPSLPLLTSLKVLKNCVSSSSSENWKVIATTWVRFLLLLSWMTTNLVTYYPMVLKVRGQKTVWLGYRESAGLHFLSRLEGRGHFLTSVKEAAWYLSSWPSPVFKTANMSLWPLLLLLHLLIWFWPSCPPLSFIGPWLLCWLT